MDTLNHTNSQLEMARNANDIGGLNTLRQAIAEGDGEVLQEAAQQFEAIFVQMMLKSMRKAQDALADQDSPFNSQQVKFYRDMHDQQLAVDLSSNGGMGLADLIVKQLGQQDPNYRPASTIRSDGNLSSINRATVEAVTQAQDTMLQSASKGSPSAYKAAMFDDQQAFVAALYPHAERAAAELGTDAKAIIAQAAVETGWGQYVIHNSQGQSSHNLFGIKASPQWTGSQAVVDTIEFNNGVPERRKAAFRQYTSLEEGLADYVNFVRSQPRYAQAVAASGDTQQYFSELQQAGYATDPDYASKVMSVYRSDTLQRFEP
ncbi:flagellar assembly peptidoglycan hydrolase FlgJ [Aestuariibacter sp. A3R04]|uniref:flagellar assembly peptidoglycan hydrolase FlgJ n=1 Tax=Aestuariibacter sp. A3R04 TaxID=2841571 RepID=UPI001C0A0AAA|nr:flagellar assembly peptidoglycan hydrolase FlgJ [Aestuariibacter sp. A3R04]MBU3022159.1 flagellar assembly peptidoglycan hydrolase FlgJ [Aestuariibacter sp. A3R04]